MVNLEVGSVFGDRLSFKGTGNPTRITVPVDFVNSRYVHCCGAVLDEMTRMLAMIADAERRLNERQADIGVLQGWADAMIELNMMQLEHRYQNAIRRCAHLRATIRDLHAKIGKPSIFEHSEPNTFHGRIRNLEADNQRLSTELRVAKDRAKNLEELNANISAVNANCIKNNERFIKEIERLRGHIENIISTYPFPVPFWHLRRHYRIWREHKRKPRSPNEDL